MLLCLLSLDCKPCIVGAADAAASLCCCKSVSACHLGCHFRPWRCEWHWLLPHLLHLVSAIEAAAMCSEAQSLAQLMQSMFVRLWPAFGTRLLDSYSSKLYPTRTFRQSSLGRPEKLTKAFFCYLHPLLPVQQPARHEESARRRR